MLTYRPGTKFMNVNIRGGPYWVVFIYKRTSLIVDRAPIWKTRKGRAIAVSM